MDRFLDTLKGHVHECHEDEPLPRRSLTPTRCVVAMTALTAAIALAWSLHIEPGDALFYPATCGVAVVYGVGTLIAGRVSDTSLPWRFEWEGFLTGMVAGFFLAAAFFVGAFFVRYVPFLREPVSELLEHARVGSLALVALTTAINGVAEEIFYRGAAWRVIAPTHRLAMTTLLYTVVTAAVGIPLLALAAAALGLLAALLRERYASLVPATVTHITWSLLMLFVLPHVVR